MSYELPVPPREFVTTELTADGSLTGAWLDADDPVRKRLQVAVEWRPVVEINGREVHQFSPDIGLDLLPILRMQLEVAHVELLADRSRAVKRSADGLADSATRLAHEIAALSTVYIQGLQRVALRHRGFPVL